MTGYRPAMPELPEVETVCRGLSATLEGQVLRRVDQHRPDLRFPLPERFAERLAGRRVDRIARRAKYILIHLDADAGDGMVLMIHLGMAGRMMVLPPDRAVGFTPGKHDHVVFHAGDGTVVTFNDTRRFGMMDLVPAADLDRHRLLADLGPEPLGRQFTGQCLHQRSRGRKQAIKAFIMDSHQVVGVGNIYANDALWLAKILPGSP